MNLTEFLKKHSKINNEFIDDFFGFYDTESHDEFCINVDIICKWLNTRKDKIKKNLMNTYKMNKDYKIFKDKKSTARVPNELILITPKCFKMICMQGKTKKSEQVREYYYELERLVDQYKEYIIKGLQEKIKTLEHNQKPKINPTKGIIYIISTSDDINCYKLGKTTNLRKRLNNYNADKKNDINILFEYETENIDAVEKCVKSLTKEYQYRKYKEIYQIDIDVLKELVVNCAELKLKINAKITQTGGNLFAIVYKNT